MQHKIWAVSATLLCALALTACGFDLPEIAPPPPRDLALTPGDGLVTVRWTANSEPDLKGYNIYYGPGSSMGPPVFIAQPATSYVVKGLINGNAYQFAISAVNNADVESERSASLSATPVQPDTTRPMVVHMVPASVSAVSVDTRIDFQFSEPMDKASLTVSAVPPIALGSPDWNSDHTQVTFRPEATLSYGTHYSITVSGRDMAGNDMDEQFTRSFQTESIPDTTPPSVASNTPGDKATGVGINTSVSLTFSEAMDISSVKPAFSIAPIITGTVLWDETRKIMTFSPTTPLSYSTDYTVTLSMGAADDAGNMLASVHSFKFTTGNAPDNTAPTVTSYSPANAQKGVSRTSGISVSFSEPMDKLSTHAAFGITTPAGLSGEFSWSHDGKTMTFTPSVSLAYGTSISWKVTTVARDVAGNSLATSVSNTFTVIRQVVTDLPVNTDGYIEHDIIRNIDVAHGSWELYRVGLTYKTAMSGTNVTAYPCNSMAYLTFDLTSLPAGLTAITSAYLNLYISTLSSDAYSKYGDMNVSSVNYGISLESNDYTDVTIYSTITTRPTTDQWASIPVWSMVDEDWKYRTARQNRSQLRMHFNVTESISVTNTPVTWTSHVMDSSRGVNKPYLRVVYEVP